MEFSTFPLYAYKVAMVEAGCKGYFVRVRVFLQAYSVRSSYRCVGAVPLLLLCEVWAKQFFCEHARKQHVIHITLLIWLGYTKKTIPQSPSSGAPIPKDPSEPRIGFPWYRWRCGGSIALHLLLCTEYGVRSNNLPLFLASLLGRFSPLFIT